MLIKNKKKEKVRHSSLFSFYHSWCLFIYERKAEGFLKKPKNHRLRSTFKKRSLEIILLNNFPEKEKKFLLTALKEKLNIPFLLVDSANSFLDKEGKKAFDLKKVPRSKNLFTIEPFEKKKDEVRETPETKKKGTEASFLVAFKKLLDAPRCICFIDHFEDVSIKRPPLSKTAFSNNLFFPLDFYMARIKKKFPFTDFSFSFQNTTTHFLPSTKRFSELPKSKFVAPRSCFGSLVFRYYTSWYKNEWLPQKYSEPFNTLLWKCDPLAISLGTQNNSIFHLGPKEKPSKPDLEKSIAWRFITQVSFKNSSRFFPLIKTMVKKSFNHSDRLSDQLSRLTKSKKLFFQKESFYFLNRIPITPSSYYAIGQHFMYLSPFLLKSNYFRKKTFEPSIHHFCQKQKSFSSALTQVPSPFFKKTIPVTAIPFTATWQKMIFLIRPITLSQANNHRSSQIPAFPYQTRLPRFTHLASVSHPQLALEAEISPETITRLSKISYYQLFNLKKKNLKALKKKIFLSNRKIYRKPKIGQTIPEIIPQKKMILQNFFSFFDYQNYLYKRPKQEIFDEFILKNRYALTEDSPRLEQKSFSSKTKSAWLKTFFKYPKKIFTQLTKQLPIRISSCAYHSLPIEENTGPRVSRKTSWKRNLGFFRNIFWVAELKNPLPYAWVDRNTFLSFSSLRPLMVPTSQQHFQSLLTRTDEAFSDTTTTSLVSEAKSATEPLRFSVLSKTRGPEPSQKTFAWSRKVALPKKRWHHKWLSPWGMTVVAKELERNWENKQLNYFHFFFQHYLNLNYYPISLKYFHLLRIVQDLGKANGVIISVSDSNVMDSGLLQPNRISKIISFDTPFSDLSNNMIKMSRLFEPVISYELFFFQNGGSNKFTYLDEWFQFSNQQMETQRVGDLLADKPFSEYFVPAQIWPTTLGVWNKNRKIHDKLSTLESTQRVYLYNVTFYTYVHYYLEINSFNSLRTLTKHFYFLKNEAYDDGIPLFNAFFFPPKLSPSFHFFRFISCFNPIKDLPPILKELSYEGLILLGKKSWMRNYLAYRVPSGWVTTINRKIKARRRRQLKRIYLDTSVKKRQTSILVAFLRSKKPHTKILLPLPTLNGKKTLLTNYSLVSRISLVAELPLRSLDKMETKPLNEARPLQEANKETRQDTTLANFEKKARQMRTTDTANKARQASEQTTSTSAQGRFETQENREFSNHVYSAQTNKKLIRMANLPGFTEKNFNPSLTKILPITQHIRSNRRQTSPSISFQTYQREIPKILASETFWLRATSEPYGTTDAKQSLFRETFLTNYKKLHQFFLAQNSHASDPSTNGTPPPPEIPWPNGKPPSPLPKDFQNPQDEDTHTFDTNKSTRKKKNTPKKSSDNGHENGHDKGSSNGHENGNGHEEINGHGNAHDKGSIKKNSSFNGDKNTTKDEDEPPKLDGLVENTNLVDPLTSKNKAANHLPSGHEVETTPKTETRFFFDAYTYHQYLTFFLTIPILSELLQIREIIPHHAMASPILPKPSGIIRFKESYSREANFFGAFILQNFSSPLFCTYTTPIGLKTNKSVSLASKERKKKIQMLQAQLKLSNYNPSMQTKETYQWHQINKFYSISKTETTFLVKLMKYKKNSFFFKKFFSRIGAMVLVPIFYAKTGKVQIRQKKRYSDLILRLENKNDQNDLWMSNIKLKTIRVFTPYSKMTLGNFLISYSFSYKNLYLLLKDKVEEIS